MNIKNRTKINRLVGQWPRGTVGTVAYLKKLGFSNSLIIEYKKNRWLESVGPGAYKLDTDKIDWLGGVYTLQKQMGLSIHPGGKSALEMRGLVHFVSGASPAEFLFGFRGERLPAWFKNYKWETRIIYQPLMLFPADLNTGLSSHTYKEFSIKISAPERAIIELLNNMPRYHTFEDCFYIFENLVSLRPQVCQELLEQCNSIKVKRLFLYMGETLNHTWLKDLDLERIGLGKGPRMIVEGGVLDPKYQITVPKSSLNYEK